MLFPLKISYLNEYINIILLISIRCNWKQATYELFPLQILPALYANS